jgi:signal transduction histidine kinase
MDMEGIRTLLGRNEVYLFVAMIVAFLYGLILAFYISKVMLKSRSDQYMKERMKQFTGLTSHYLLTPISIIQTAITRLEDGESTMDQLERLRMYEAIKRGQQRLWIMAEQLLLVNEIDDGNMQIKYSVSDLSNTLSDSIAAVDCFARPKRIKILYEDNLGQVRETRYDPRRLQQAIIALLDNSIKFSQEDSTIRMGVWLQDEIITISITDSGIGMNKEIQQHLGERFYRGSQLYNFDYEGLGLGLHIAYAIIRLHQGHISFVTRPGKGTTTIVEFPAI